jgi:hypothetical protein
MVRRNKKPFRWIAVVLGGIALFPVYAEEETLLSDGKAKSAAGEAIMALDLQTSLFDSAKAKTISDNFRLSLEESGRFAIVKRSADPAAGFPAACFKDDNCLMEAAKASGATALLTGVISAIDDKHAALSIRVISVETGKIVYSASRTGENGFRAIVSLVNTLADTMAKGCPVIRTGMRISEALENEKGLSETRIAGAAPAKMAQRYVSVLPFTGERMDTNLLGILEDDFRAALAKTGVFEVMERAMMKEILEEQNFQMTDRCDSTTCVVEVGKVIGVSKIISATVSKTKKNTYAVSARLIDVATAQDLVTGSEEREGEVYKTVKRILENLATVLAGKPDKDHLRYVNDLRRVLDRQKKRLFVEFYGGAYRFVDVFQPDNNAKIKAAWGTDTVTTVYSAYHFVKKDYIRDPAWKAPAANVSGNRIDPCAVLKIGYNLSNKFGVFADIGVLNSQWYESHFSATALYTYHFDSTSHGFGQSTITKTTWDQWRLISLGVGVQVFLIQNPYFEWSLNLAPHYVHGSYRRVVQSGSQSVIQIYQGENSVDQVPKGLDRDNIDVLLKDNLTGNGIGGEISTKATYSVTPWFGISVFGGIDLNYLFRIEGKESMTTHLQRVDFLNNHTDTTTVESNDVELVYGHDASYAPSSGSWFAVKLKKDKWPQAEKRPLERAAVRFGINLNFNF